MERRGSVDEELDSGARSQRKPERSTRDGFQETEGRIRALIEESTLRIETQSLQVVKRALEAISALEDDWKRARSESVALEERPDAIIHIDGLVVEPLPSGTFGLQVRGWIERQEAIDFLELTFDGERLLVVEFNEFREDVAEYLGQSLAENNGFHFGIPVEAGPGEHRLELVAHRQGKDPVVWRRVEEFEVPTDRIVRAEAVDLGDLQRSRLTDYYFSIRIGGRVDSERHGLRASLFLDDARVDECPVESGTPFVLRHVPDRSGRHDLRVEIGSNRQVFYDSGPRPIFFGAPKIPVFAEQNLAVLIDLLGLRGLVSGSSAEEITRLVLEADPERPLAFFSVLEELAARARAQPKREVEQPSARGSDPEPPARRLNVLMASWEVPCLRHGGGVCTTNLVRELSARHDITLVHSYGDDDVGWWNELGQHVRRLISIPREVESSRLRRDLEIPGACVSNYTPRLRHALEAEILSGDYDLVDYYSGRMYPYVVPAGVPRVLTLFEAELAGALLGGGPTSDGPYSRARWIRDLLRLFYFEHVELPRLCPHLVAVSQEDAVALARFGTEAEVHVNSIGVDATRFAPPGPVRTETGDGADRSPTFVFLGNYRHTPNRGAVHFFAGEVMPRLRQRLEGARFLIVGGGGPELRELKREDGVELVGFVEDFRPLLWEATAFVSPLFSGTGMRVKILEAMACGTPLVATPLSLRGTRAEAGRHYARAETADEFVERCVELAKDPEAARRLGREARRLVTEHHSLARQAAEREQIWRRVIGDWATRPE